MARREIRVAQQRRLPIRIENPRFPRVNDRRVVARSPRQLLPKSDAQGLVDSSYYTELRLKKRKQPSITEVVQVSTTLREWFARSRIPLNQVLGEDSIRGNSLPIFSARLEERPLYMI